MSAAAFASTPVDPDAGRVERDLLGTLEPLGRRGRLWIAGLVTVVGLGAVAYVFQLIYGLRVTAMRDHVSWGLYMTNFVFFIGISHAGTLISAILRVTDAGWRRPITRMAEAITVFALMVGAPMVIIDMGRPDRLLNIFAHGRLQSPILWDVCSIATYLTGSILYLYVAMIPDMSVLARWAIVRRKSRRLVRLYEVLSLGYRDTPEQRRRLRIALGVMAVIIIPVAVSVHTVVSWIFGMTLRPGWHSTIFGPYFVVGAIFSGTAAIITAMAIFRRAYHLERYITPRHFRNLAKVLLALTLLYIYFTLSEYLTTWYGGMASDARLVDLLMGGTAYGASFWLWVLFGLFVPLGLLIMPGHRSLTAIVSASVLINVGMWLKRYLIVVPTLETPFIPLDAAGVVPHYFPSLVEWTITAGALAAFMLLYTLFSRVFPIVSIWETVEDLEEAHAPKPAPRPASSQPWPVWEPFLVALFAAGIGLLALAPTIARAAQSPPSGAKLELTKEIEDGEEMVIATVTIDGRPLEGAQIAFFVGRTFGNMTLGEDVTLDDGTAAVPFPRDFPGDGRGELRILAEIVSPKEFAGARVEAVMPGGVVTTPNAEPFPRALWSPRAPIGLMATIGALLAIVWSMYAFVILQLTKIRKLGKEGKTMQPRKHFEPGPLRRSPIPGFTPLILGAGLLGLGLIALARPTAADPPGGNACVPWEAPARRARVANPLPASEAVIAEGRKVYQAQCQVCHGPRGNNDGASKDVMQCAPRLSDPAMWKKTDGELFWKVSEGRAPMPSWKNTLTEHERWAVIHFVRTLAPKR